MSKLVGTRVIAGLVAGALIAAGTVVAPAFGATEQQARIARRVAVARVAGTFTPAAADPRLAAVFARGGLDLGAFRFTPAETSRGDRAVTVAVRARSNRVLEARRGAAPVAGTVGLAPIAYNLGVAVGWKRFAVSGDVGRVDLAGRPGSRENVDLGVSYTDRRVTGRVVAAADRPIDDVPRGIAEMPSYSLDLGGSYALTRNLEVTAGVRYKTERERLARVNDDRRDSQAVYVGTAFRF